MEDSTPMSPSNMHQPSVTPTTEQLLQQAIAYHQSGNLMEAGTLYKTILAKRSQSSGGKP